MILDRILDHSRAERNCTHSKALVNSPSSYVKCVFKLFTWESTPIQIIVYVAVKQMSTVTNSAHHLTDSWLISSAQRSVAGYLTLCFPASRC